MKKNHDKMKEGNKRIAQARKTGEDITLYLMNDFDIPPHRISHTLKFGFYLTNNNANMRRVEDRIKELEIKDQKANTTGEKEFLFDGYKVVYNYEADRIQVIHNTKPAPEIITECKRNGFKWSPRFGAWQRNLNANGIWAAERLLKIKLPRQ